MDYEDEILREDLNISFSPNATVPDTPEQYIAQEVTLIVFGLLGIVANILLIFMFCYFRKLHTSVNILIVNWAIADIGAMLITVSCFRVFASFVKVPEIILCFHFSLGGALLFNAILFMIFITVDWCLFSHFPGPLERFRDLTKVIVLCSWILGVFYLIASTVLCSLSHYHFVFHLCLPLAFGLLLIFIAVLHTVRIIQKLRNRHEYKSAVTASLPTVFVLCWCLSWLNLFVHVPSEFIILIDSLLFLHPVINFGLLISLDTDFKLCFVQLLKSCAFRNHL